MKLDELISSTMGKFQQLPVEDGDVHDDIVSSINKSEISKIALKYRVPKGFDWAKLGTKEWQAIEAKSPKLATFVRGWNVRLGSAILIGPTGVGKTAALVALMHRILDSIKLDSTTEAKARIACDIRFMSASSLVVARRNSSLGHESSIIESACSCFVLFLDELGFESNSTIPFEVVDSRYMSGKPTIITSGLTEKELEKKYGTAFIRRIRDRGRIWDLWGE